MRILIILVGVLAVANHQAVAGENSDAGAIVVSQEASAQRWTDNDPSGKLEAMAGPKTPDRPIRKSATSGRTPLTPVRFSNAIKNASLLVHSPQRLLNPAKNRGQNMTYPPSVREYLDHVRSMGGQKLTMADLVAIAGNKGEVVIDMQIPQFLVLEPKDMKTLKKLNAKRFKIDGKSHYLLNSSVGDQIVLRKIAKTKSGRRYVAVTILPSKIANDGSFVAARFCKEFSDKDHARLQAFTEVQQSILAVVTQYGFGQKEFIFAEQIPPEGVGFWPQERGNRRPSEPGEHLWLASGETDDGGWRWQVEKWLGSGNMGNVWLVKITAPSGEVQSVVVKTQNADDQTYREVQVGDFLNSVSSTFSNTQLGAFVFQNGGRSNLKLATVSAPCDGSLDSLVTDPDHPARQIVAENFLSVLWQMAKGAQPLAVHGILHKDYKLANFLFRYGPAKGGKDVAPQPIIRVYVADLGLCRTSFDEDSLGCTPGLSPDLSTEGRHTSAFDVHCLGKTFEHLLDDEELSRNLSKVERSSLVALTRHMTVEKPEDRPTFAHVIEVLRGHQQRDAE